MFTMLHVRKQHNTTLKTYKSKKSKVQNTNTKPTSMAFSKQNKKLTFHMRGDRDTDTIGGKTFYKIRGIKGSHFS